MSDCEEGKGEEVRGKAEVGAYDLLSDRNL